MLVHFVPTHTGGGYFSRVRNFVVQRETRYAATTAGPVVAVKAVFFFSEWTPLAAK